MGIKAIFRHDQKQYQYDEIRIKITA